MTDREFQQQLQAALHDAGGPVRPEHLQQTRDLVRAELRKGSGGERIGFAAFLCRQIRFIGWKIWLAQALLLVAVSGFLAASLGEFFLNDPRFVAGLLCCLSVMVPMTALPFVHRSVHCRMHETEAATHFSAVRLLLAKLIIIGIGDLAMLAAFLGLAVLKTPLAGGAAILYLLIPFLLAACGLLYLLGHVPAKRFTRHSLGLCGLLLAAIAVLTQFYPGFYPQTFSPGWAAACLFAVIFGVRQCRRIAGRAAYAEMQLT